MARLLLGLSLVRRSAPAQSRPIAEALDAAKAKLGVEGDVIVRASRQARSPVIWCWGRRPVLLVPSGSCDDARLDWSSILCHELAHWKRRDHISSLLAELMICLLPWQPFSWLARRRLAGPERRGLRRLGDRLRPGGHALCPHAAGSDRPGPGCTDPRRGDHQDRSRRPHPPHRRGRMQQPPQRPEMDARCHRRSPPASPSPSPSPRRDLCRRRSWSRALAAMARASNNSHRPSRYEARCWTRTMTLSGQPVHVTALPMTCYAVEPNGQKGTSKCPGRRRWVS